MPIRSLMGLMNTDRCHRTKSKGASSLEEAGAGDRPLAISRDDGRTGRLNNSGEKIRLRNELSEEIDELTYSDQRDWAVRRRGSLANGHEGWVWELVVDGGGGSREL